MSREFPEKDVRESADILIEAHIKADELRFERAPESSVEFTGDADDASASGSTRRNLPDKVQENVTYYDVEIDYAIAARLASDASGRATEPRTTAPPEPA
ncbi:hypothetical protein [Actinomadura roseirufa]|uniref:hypothetical protein n=1 Tax=Actinomadura roseirufa TaxID=2094049 RepID=UPI0010410A3F|nr:hypothetical protein [Actinomadura roseirufa]